MGDLDDGFIVKLLGLPWSANAEHVLKFFHECKIKGGKEGIHMITSREGRPTGEAFMELEDMTDVESACKKDRLHFGNRYIKVFRALRVEMEWVIKRSGSSYKSNEDGCVRLRGLPFGCTKEEIAHFFTGLEIVPHGITLLRIYSGRSCGEAYVQFVNKEVAEKALQKHREQIGERYIEIYRSSFSEVSSILSLSNRRMDNSRHRPTPYDRYGGGGGAGGSVGMDRYQGRLSRPIRSFFTYNPDYNYNYLPPWNPYIDPNQLYNYNYWNLRSRAYFGMHCIHMRGLPFRASETDIVDFFKPIVPTAVRLLPDESGRASGDADVDFASHEDAVRAMSKDKGHMQHRYVELFLNSSPAPLNRATYPPNTIGIEGIGHRRP